MIGGFISTHPSVMNPERKPGQPSGAIHSLVPPQRHSLPKGFAQISATFSRDLFGTFVELKDFD